MRSSCSTAAVTSRIGTWARSAFTNTLRRRSSESTSAASTPRRSSSAASRRVRRDKSLFWASAVIEAVRDEVGTLAGFVKITRDMTEKREAQASLERAQEQLAESQK